MDELEYQRLRLKKKHQLGVHEISKPTTSNQYVKKVFTRFLLAVIFVLVSAIYVNWSKDNLVSYRSLIFDSHLSFTAINEWYEKHFGSVLPIDLEPGTVAVNKGVNDFRDVQSYQNGVRISTTQDSIINALNSGIVVFMGEKENYGYVVIVQGVDGVDIWYGNLANVSLSLYDYVEKSMLLGMAKEDHIYLVFQKDGQYLDYEEYQKEI